MEDWDVASMATWVRGAAAAETHGQNMEQRQLRVSPVDFLLAAASNGSPPPPPPPPPLHPPPSYSRLQPASNQAHVQPITDWNASIADAGTPVVVCDAPAAEAAMRFPTAQELAQAKTPRTLESLSSWYKKLNQLIEYKQSHGGSCNVPQKYSPNPPLGFWVNKQRIEKTFLDQGNRSSMTDAKIQQLESIGFVWAKRKGFHAWKSKYNELRIYQAEKKHCDVPTKFGALGRWVSTQRKEYKLFCQNKSKHMTQFKVDALNALGFKWVAVPGQQSL